MIRGISEKMIFEVSEFVGERIGLHFPPERWSDLERGIQAAAKEFGFQDVPACVEWLLAAPLTRKEIETLASCLTIGETFFFREKRSFELLEEKILPELIRGRQNSDRRLRVWSAGCATGEEPYSIAIMLSRLIPDWKEWNITLLATDINPRFLEKAREGVYTEWSFRECPAWLKENYFKKKKENLYKILPAIHEKVTFAYLNLAEDVYPSLSNNTNAMDLIFCRNVLMYFVPARAKKVIENFHHCLVEGGCLVVSPVEMSSTLYPQFDSVSFPDAVFYRKENRPKIFPQPPVVFVEEVAPAPEAVFVLPDPKAIQEEARQLYQQGLYFEVIQKLGKLPPRNNGDAETLALLARAHANQGELAEAEQVCRKAISVEKLHPGTHYLLATILQEQGKTTEAAAALKKVIYLDPSFALAHFALGNLAWRQGKTREAEKHFENAVSLLAKFRPEEILAESEGISAGRLVEIIRRTLVKEVAA